ncbi:MAG: tRNA pseudouridine(38-40) synthase TruA [Pirellulales bacterium]|nr:tRNA pseudouridine(38-40) synthase TruA [Pirellulales bacterium]
MKPSEPLAMAHGMNPAEQGGEAAASAGFDAAPSSTLRGIKLTVAYDGSNYLGWQSQCNGRTIQEVLEKVGRQIAGEKVNMHASGRTDAGVHALGQVISFRTHARHTPEVWLRAFNGFLPTDIGVIRVEETSPVFHARVHAVGKCYRYLLHDGPRPEALAQRALWQYSRPLDLARMQEAASLLQGTHDFYSFQSGGSRRRTTIRTVRDIRLWRPFDPAAAAESATAQSPTRFLSYPAEARPYPLLLHPAGLIVLEITADGFLYNMVRTILGTLVQVGTGRRAIDWPAQVLAARDRRQAGQTAPAQGLYLVSVDYGDGHP